MRRYSAGDERHTDRDGDLVTAGRRRAAVVLGNPGDDQGAGGGKRRAVCLDRVPLAPPRLAAASYASAGRELHRARRKDDRCGRRAALRVGGWGRSSGSEGVPHTFRVESGTARVLVLSTPAGLERFVRDAAVPAKLAMLPPFDTPRPSAPELDRIFLSHGQINVGPPLGPDD